MSTIAVVEDNPDNRLLVRAILEDHFTVAEYKSGPEALEGLRVHRADLVLMDISLPGMDGTVVLERIRDDPQLRELPVVALTAHAMASDRERLLDLGFDGYLPKPITDESELIGLIRKLLGD